MDEFSKALIDSVTAENVKEITADMLQTTTELVSNNEAVKAIPFFGTALKVWKGLNSYKDFLFLKVIHRFLYAYSTVSKEKRIEFLIKMEDNPEFQEKVGEKLIFILNRLDDLEKANVLGNLFKAYVEGKFSFILFNRLSAIVDKIFYHDMQCFANGIIGKLPVMPLANRQSLANAGFLDIELQAVQKSKSVAGVMREGEYDEIQYNLNAYSALIIRYGLLISFDADFFNSYITTIPEI